MYLIGFPLLVITFAIYNMIAFLTPSLAWTASVATIHLISGQDWTVTPEDIILALAILLLGVVLWVITWIANKATGTVESKFDDVDQISG